MNSHSMPHVTVPEDRNRLINLDADALDGGFIAESLRHDRVVLIRNVAPEQADPILHDVAERLGLLEDLRRQAAFATLLGHRQRIGKYRMSVNQRAEYQFIPPHSEGDSFVNVQLASFYGFDNTTDGGETILLNVDDASDSWPRLRERVTRIAPGSRPLTAGELKQATTLYHFHSSPALTSDDRILAERASDIPGLKLVDVLAKARRTRSSILDRDVHAYWFSISIMDFDSLHFYAALLTQNGLLRVPGDHSDIAQLDNAYRQRAWSSGADYNELFACKITHKLLRGDLVLQNNLTWTHAVSNWTPGSGIRKVSAAFA